DPLGLAETARLLEAHAEAPGRAAQRTLPSVLAAVAVHADREHLVAARGEEVERGDGGVVLPAEDPPHAGDHDPSAASTAARGWRTTGSGWASGGPGKMGSTSVVASAASLCGSAKRCGRSQ